MTTLDMVLLIDIDKVMSAAEWRDPLIDSDGWEAYHAQSHRDQPILAMVEFARSLFTTGWQVVPVTARPERFRQMTMNWLVHERVPTDDLLMRPNDDFRTSPEVKIALVLERFPPGPRVLVVDDREDVCVAFMNLGYATLQFRRKVDHVAAGIH